MQKIKTILVAASLLAVVGGALAFKASKFGVTYCSGVAYVDGTAISACTTSAKFTTVNPDQIIYAKVKTGSSCSGETCPSLNLAAE